MREKARRKINGKKEKSVLGKLLFLLVKRASGRGCLVGVNIKDPRASKIIRRGR